MVERPSTEAPPLAKAIAFEIRHILRLFLVVAPLLPADQATAEVSEGAQIAATCVSCHDQDKRGQSIPSITALDERAIINAMLAFRASASPSHVMHAVALSLTDGELAAVARYLAEKAKGGGQQ
ncbi:cytochrome C [Rhizobium sp. P32RR-XVIII]|uniref:c-type cytochrome n=1 Tax=Rhizobium sp. P32RR-XVIII TaxID=2726738 RepID=UPI001456A8B3|nr:cytochrome C [Rhizobium sp. P32RR-XVIII]NLS07523.1 cytochrome C [Rhizobium sp. P32RR-XVIII]